MNGPAVALVIAGVECCAAAPLLFGDVEERMGKQAAEGWGAGENGGSERAGAKGEWLVHVQGRGVKRDF